MSTTQRWVFFLTPSALPPPPLHADLLAEKDVELMQNMSCKVDAATLKPATYSEQPDMEWWVQWFSAACG